MNKVVKTLREAIRLAGLESGMTISFHHHLRNGDYVLNMALAEIAALGMLQVCFSCHKGDAHVGYGGACQHAQVGLFF